MTIISETLSLFPFATFRELMGPLGLNTLDYRGSLMDPIKPSTITVGGHFTNVSMHEERDIARFRDMAREPIVKIGSNFGEWYAPGYTDPVKPPKTSKRGRKPKPKKAKTRIQGNGKYFNSQITSCVRSARDPNKIYKIKKYRNGKFQVPGVLDGDMADIDAPLLAITKMLSTIFGVTVEVHQNVVQMRNCKTILSDLSLTINTGALGRVIELEKDSGNPMQISSVEYMSAQNSSKVIVKFARPTKDKATKKTTLKILKQKINIEGAVDKQDVDEIYIWLNRIFIENYDHVINDPQSTKVADSSETDESSEDETVTTIKSAQTSYNPYEF